MNDSLYTECGGGHGDCVHDLLNILTTRRIYDISVSLGSKAIDYPGDTAHNHEVIGKIEDGEICDLSELTMSAHSGTHLDAPAHFVNGDKSIDQYQLTDFIRSVRVVATKDLVSLKSAEISELTIPPGSGALSKTENSESDAVKAGHFSETYVYISAEAAHVCVAWKPSVIGIDCISIENDNDKNFPAHRAILGGGIPVLEGIDLAGVEPGNYTLFCLP